MSFEKVRLYGDLVLQIPKVATGFVLVDPKEIGNSSIGKRLVERTGDNAIVETYNLVRTIESGVAETMLKKIPAQTLVVGISLVMMKNQGPARILAEVFVD